jgi:hypothetical protein
MAKIRVKKTDFERALKIMKREALIGGKKVAQGHSCVFQSSIPTANRLIATSLVKDGVSGWTEVFLDLLEPAATTCCIVVANIDYTLNVLKMHGDILTLEQDQQKLRIKSQKKQTTLSANLKANAFPNSQKTIEQWEKQSVEIRNKLVLWLHELGASYHTGSGDKLESKYAMTVDPFAIKDAIETVRVNGQIVANCHMVVGDQPSLTFAGGDESKGGWSITQIIEPTQPGELAKYEVAGGLENIVTMLGKEVNLFVIEWQSKGEGLLIISGENGHAVRRVACVE